MGACLYVVLYAVGAACAAGVAVVFMLEALTTREGIAGIGERVGCVRRIRHLLTSAPFINRGNGGRRLRRFRCFERIRYAIRAIRGTRARLARVAGVGLTVFTLAIVGP
jgi:hypothetical protein